MLSTVLGLLAVMLLAIALMLLLRSHTRQESLREALTQLERRLHEQGSQGEARARTSDELVRRMDASARDGQANMQQQLERRLGESQAHQAEAIATLQLHMLERVAELQRAMSEQLSGGGAATLRQLDDLREQVRNTLLMVQAGFEKRQGEAIVVLQDTLQRGARNVQSQLAEALAHSAEALGKRLDALAQTTDRRLNAISEQVEKRLSEGFERTTATFADILKRLALIDEAQKRITELSSNVVSLQEVLSDKRSRGVFGEVQLTALVRNVLPETHFALQHTLSNSKIVDCMLFLPHPTGNVAIDAKFPLEAYRRMMDEDLSELQRRAAQRQFKSDIREHIDAIAEKYIIPGETAEGAVMFIPAEAVFAEIQAHHPDLVQVAYSRRVWMVSPTTLMAILNTARAVLKDEATREQVHIIQQHLKGLARDFDRFQKRMDNLARHIHLANRDVDEVHVSARKITNRFERIERVELDGTTEEPVATLDSPEAKAPDI